MSPVPELDPTAPPGRWPCRTVGLAVWVLPSGARRERYRREFESEMYGMARRDQVRFAAGVLAQAWALRSALARASREMVMETKVAWWRRLWCRLGQHDWVQQRAEDGRYFRLCVRCGRDDYRPSGGGTGGVEFGIMGGSH